MTSTIRLPSRLDRKSAAELASKLSEHAGKPLALDVSDVTLGTTLGLQVLAAARRQWAAAGQEFALLGRSDKLLDACKTLGIPADAIGLATTET